MRLTLTNNKGFTLIEVMISLFILVIIGTATSKAVIDAAKLKENLKDETEFGSEFRTSISLIERDLNQVFNPRWFLAADAVAIDPYAQPSTSPGAATTNTLTSAEMNNKLRGTAFQAYDYWGPVYDLSGLRTSRFKGDDHSMSFVTASHTRIYQEKKESIYSKVKYEVIKQPPNSNLNKEQNEKLTTLSALAKYENPRAFELEEPRDAPYVQTYIVLNQIKNIKFSYYKAGEKNPVKVWDSEAVDTKGKFPEMVEAEFTVQSLTGRIIDGKVLFKLEAPNEILPKTY